MTHNALFPLGLDVRIYWSQYMSTAVTASFHNRLETELFARFYSTLWQLSLGYISIGRCTFTLLRKIWNVVPFAPPILPTKDIVRVTNFECYVVALEYR